MRTATFALFIGVAYLAAGVLGMVPDALHAPAPEAPPTTFTVLYGNLLGLFPVNVLHSAVHLVIGVLGLAAWQADHVWHRMSSPRTYARALAVLYGTLAVLGLIPGLNTLFGMLPLYGHDVWLHLGTAILAAYFGWRSVVEVERRAAERVDRREESVAVEHERRRGHSDRRIPGSEV
jgi:hypothetical protein